jgi:phospholipid N-methyltransferase
LKTKGETQLPSASILAKPMLLAVYIKNSLSIIEIGSFILIALGISYSKHFLRNSELEYYT